MGAHGLVIRNDIGVAELRRFARGEADRRAALRALAIAQALEGASRADAARVVGRERQSLRDAVLRYNAEGLAGLHDRPRSGRPEQLTASQREELRAWVLQGPDPEVDGVNGGSTVRKSGGVIFPNSLRSPAPEPRCGSGAGERCRWGTEPVM